ncbi:MAG: CT583 family protein [Candidatus Algichlamydia australiensis]|nr:CT583 family protein [Chlamydiales bacterium]
MAKVSQLLSKRFESDSSKLTKMKKVATRGAQGNLSGFSGVFKVQPLSEQEKESIETILLHYSTKKSTNEKDLTTLSTLTSELKAINNQAIILHGERIQQAQRILKRYKNGAFTAWLMMTYGNRQTPYNFLQYFEFYQTLSKDLREKLDSMPKQAVYTLASRDGENSHKEKIVKNYNGEPKHILIEEIRKLFPLTKRDKRKSKLPKNTITVLKKLLDRIKAGEFAPSQNERNELNLLLTQLMNLTNNM